MSIAFSSRYSMEFHDPEEVRLVCSVHHHSELSNELPASICKSVVVMAFLTLHFRTAI